jgi:hypothetical protein
LQVRYILFLQPGNGKKLRRSNADSKVTSSEDSGANAIVCCERLSVCSSQRSPPKTHKAGRMDMGKDASMPNEKKRIKI